MESLHNGLVSHKQRHLLPIGHPGSFIKAPLLIEKPIIAPFGYFLQKGDTFLPVASAEARKSLCLGSIS